MALVRMNVRRLGQAKFSETQSIGATNHDVVEYADIYELQSIHDLLSDSLVGVRRLRHSIRWLCASITATVLCNSAAIITSRGYTHTVSIVLKNISS